MAHAVEEMGTEPQFLRSRLVAFWILVPAVAVSLVVHEPSFGHVGALGLALQLIMPGRMANLLVEVLRSRAPRGSP